MKKVVFIFLVLGGSLSTWAENIIIADFGGESAVRFYESLQPEHDVNAPYYPNALPSFVSEFDMLPIVSHKLTPGKVKNKSFDLAGIQPIFLIGTDSLSRHWITENYQRLYQLDATGLVVNVNNKEELIFLRTLAPELLLLPVSGDDLAERIPLSHYPALITETGVSQ
ncbi:integrating conjugative element protein (TIGR03765 family) [Bisgaardia hudsonensis]|uniref:Integrating conjugative element protein (TIGR03765 family) n=1 Tax=Bisgaardia hudsonensis TaxID=109472 RepID=A0A4R2N366_9PAST|nr:integrating conjugative element protein [Bisgaardia hudsonensis]QLB12776.1 integrating conjugative element protein [Bisgaardia hudsonensis]TCP14328.1 integrating conjugative element protein (TIGR03765 family) [Bisgaardia hudsonensis]